MENDLSDTDEPSGWTAVSLCADKSDQIFAQSEGSSEQNIKSC